MNVQQVRAMGADEERMAGPRESFELREVADDARCERVRVHIANHRAELRIVLDRNGLVSVLEEVPDPLVPAVEMERVAGVDAQHRTREGSRSRARDEMDVIRHEREREERQAAFP